MRKKSFHGTLEGILHCTALRWGGGCCPEGLARGLQAEAQSTVTKAFADLWQATNLNHQRLNRHHSRARVQGLRFRLQTGREQQSEALRFVLKVQASDRQRLLRKSTALRPHSTSSSLSLPPCWLISVELYHTLGLAMLAAPSHALVTVLWVLIWVLLCKSCFGYGTFS
jgi:hypothetical protein